MTHIQYNISTKKGCRHPSVLGVSFIGDQEVGLCTKCTHIVDNRKGYRVSKDVALLWMDRHPQETQNFNLNEVYGKKKIN